MTANGISASDRVKIPNSEISKINTYCSAFSVHVDVIDREVILDQEESSKLIMGIVRDECVIRRNKVTFTKGVIVDTDFLTGEDVNFIYT